MKGRLALLIDNKFLYVFTDISAKRLIRTKGDSLLLRKIKKTTFVTNKMLNDPKQSRDDFWRFEEVRELALQHKAIKKLDDEHY